MSHRLRRCVFPVAGLVVLSSIGAVVTGPARRAGAVPDSPGLTTRVSLKTGGAQAEAQGPAAAGQPAVSDNGSVVAFTSDATNLVAGDHNGVSDVFVSQGGRISRVSLGPNFAEADGPSFGPVLSSDGRYVAFTSAADNLVPGDTNDALDVFVYDRSSTTVTRVSVAADGGPANGDSRSPSIDDTGTVIAFTSAATNLVAGDTNGKTDVFVRRLGPSPSTRLVSAAAGGTGPGNGASDEPGLTGTATLMVFSSDASDLVAGDTNGKTDVFLADLDANTVQRVSMKDQSTTVAGNGDSFSPSISADGNVVAFASEATNLVPSVSDDNDTTDVFLRDRTDPAHPKTDLLSRCGTHAGNDRSYAPRLSSDAGAGNAAAGVSFVSDATDLLSGACKGPGAPDDHNAVSDVYFRPIRQSPAVNERVSLDAGGAEFTRGSVESAVSGDGRTVAFTVGALDPTTGRPGAGAEVYQRDRGSAPGVTTRLSAPTNGAALGPAATGFPALSGDGRTVAYASAAPDLVAGDTNGVTDVFVSDRTKNQTVRVSVGAGGAEANGPSATDSAPALSADGQIVAFASEASNLVAGDTNNAEDVFVYDRAAGTTTRVSVGPGGAQAGGDSYDPAVSGDGRYVAFASDAADLVPGDTNRATDVFVHDRVAGTTTRVSVGPGGAQAGGVSSKPSLSGDGRVLAFLSDAPDLVAGDTNGDTVADVFVRDLETGTTTEVRGNGGDGPPGDGPSGAPRLSADGRTVAFASAAANLVPGDTNGVTDAFVFDRAARTVERVSLGPGGVEGDHDSAAPAVSADGRFVAFASDATNLVPTDTNRRTDVFVRDRRLGTTSRVSLGPRAAEGDRPSTEPGISADGRYVSFVSAAGNLVAGDTNSAPDVFVHDRTPVLGYWLVGSDGGIFAYGSADFAGSTGATRLARPIVGLAAAPSGLGYWLAASDGGVFAFGGARFFGSTGAMRLSRPIVGLAPTPSGAGYWLVASDGGVFAFGDAGFFGSTGALRLAQPIVGMAATPTGKGYWLVARDGGVFAFGDAGFFGSTGALRLAQPVVGMAATPSGGGYWLAGSDGGIFAFGDAAFRGSTGGLRLNRPMVGLAATPTGAGYWLVASDGGIFAFGDATFFGSAGAVKLAQPIVGLAARP